jgi:hypothetical protein
MIQSIWSLLCEWLCEKTTPGKRRLLIAIVCYLALIGVALYVLLPVQSKHDKLLLGTVLAVFTILIVKTLAHSEDN